MVDDRNTVKFLTLFKGIHKGVHKVVHMRGSTFCQHPKECIIKLRAAWVKGWTFSFFFGGGEIRFFFS